MSEEKAFKKIGTVFGDFKCDSNILNAKIERVNLYKKNNSFEVFLMTDKPVKIEEVHSFEKFLAKRFMLTSASVRINYETDEDYSKNLSNDCKNVVDYISYRYPMTKAILRNSNVDIDENNINIKLHMSGKDFLAARGMNKVFEDTVENIYNKKFKVTFSDAMTAEEESKYKEVTKQLEEEAINNVSKQIEDAKLEKEQKKAEKEAKKASKEASGIQNINNPSNGEMPPLPDDKDIPMDAIEEEIEEDTPLIYGRNANIREPLTKIIDLGIDSGKVCIEGEILNQNKDYVSFKESVFANYADERKLKSGKTLYMFDLYDGTSTITCKAFIEEEKLKKFKSRMKEAAAVKVGGTAQFDPYSKELGVIADVIVEEPGTKKAARMDESKVKRVELHMHTKMSQMDAITNAKDLIKRAMKWGMKSIAITDHGVVQSFPEAHKLLGYDNPDMKVIYGVEAYYVPDKAANVTNPQGQDIDTTYCVLDLETTGLSFRTEKITEIGIMKYKDGEVIDSLSTFVNPQRPIPQEVIDVTHITDEMVADAPTIDQIMPKVLEFIGDSVIVAHNADFDVGFLKHNCKLLGLKFENTYVDTLRLAKDLFPDYKKYKLGIIAENLGIKVDVAHRALDDVDTTVKVFRIMIDMIVATI